MATTSRSHIVGRAPAAVLLALITMVGAAMLPMPAGAGTGGVAATSVEVGARAKAGQLTVKPAAVVAGDRVKVKGTVGSGPRQVKVQVKLGKGHWSTVRSLRTKRSGKFRTKIAIVSPRAVVAKVRAKAPRAKVRGKKRSGVTTRSRTVNVVIGAGAEVERQTLALINAERAGAGCAPLANESHLYAAARGHSADMAARGYFSHDSLDGRDVGDRADSAGYTGWSLLGENIALGQPTPATVVNDWMNSPGHRANIEKCGYTETGLAAVRAADGRIYWTQDFGSRS